MGVLQYAMGAGYRRFYDNLGKISEETGKKRFVMFLDAAICTLRYGSGLTDYLNYEFYRKKAGERKQYVTIRTQDRFYKKVSPPEYKEIFTVKPNFMKAFAAYTGRKYFYPPESDIEGLRAFLSENSVFMEKPIDGLGGHGVKKVSSSDIGTAEEYFKYLTENRMFIEQYIIQHDRLAALCESSVNTLRIVTSSTGGTSKIVFAGLRVGNGSCEIDNFHGGGMCVLVNEENGVLTGGAVDKSLRKFEKHPVTGVRFDGYQLPYWEEVKRIVNEAAFIEPRIKVIGWDVAITNEGPVFVEGNRRPGFDIIQVACGRGRKDIVDTALRELRDRN